MDDDLNVVKDILATGFEPDTLGDADDLDEIFKWSALHCASFYGRQAIVELLMDAGATIELEDTLFQGVCHFSSQ